MSDVSDLDSVAAGSELLAVLLALDFPLLSEAELLAVARAWERQDRFVSARRNLLYAALDSADAPPWRGHPAVSGPQGWRDLVGKARTRSLAGSTGLSNTAAAQRIDAASLLTGRLAETGAALERGLISEGCARLIARRVSGMDEDTAVAVQYAVLDAAPDLTHARLDRLLRREIAQRTAMEEQERNRAARHARKVTAPRPLAGGMSSLEVVGPAEDVAVLYTAITALGDAAQAAAQAAARAAGAGSRLSAAHDAHDAGGRGEGGDGGVGGDGGGGVGGVGGVGVEVGRLDAHRFDALINLACGALHDDGLPTRHGRRPTIQVVVPAATLLGIDEMPGELDGYGPIDADTARAIALDPTATWRRILTDPQGRVLDYGQTTYRPPQALKDLIIARDRTCTGPGCSTPARQCQIDHEVPYPRGSTSAGNNDPKCGTEHNLKTTGLFTAVRDHDTGATIWADRHGTPYLRLPETLPLAPTSDDRLADITRALRQGRHRIDAIRNRAVNRRGARITQSERDDTDHPASAGRLAGADHSASVDHLLGPDHHDSDDLPPF